MQKLRLSPLALPTCSALRASLAGGACSFVGSHLDVVPANPETWNCDPFKLTVDPDGDRLFGRGTTDCRISTRTPHHTSISRDLF